MLVKVGRKLCNLFGGRINTTLNQCDKFQPTHIIVKSDTQNEKNKLLMQINRKVNLSKLYHGILMGAWVVTDEWLRKCESGQQWVDEKAFEIQGDTNATSSIKGGKMNQ